MNGEKASPLLLGKKDQNQNNPKHYHVTRGAKLFKLTFE